MNGSLSLSLSNPFEIATFVTCCNPKTIRERTIHGSVAHILQSQNDSRERTIHGSVAHHWLVFKGNTLSRNYLWCLAIAASSAPGIHDIHLFIIPVMASWPRQPGCESGYESQIQQRWWIIIQSSGLGQERQPLISQEISGAKKIND